MTGLGVPALAGELTTIDVPEATSTQPLGINPQGDIVGNHSDTSFITHGFLLRNGTFSTIDTPASTSITDVHGINAKGDLVGGYTDSSGNHRGFLLSHGAYTT